MKYNCPCGMTFEPAYNCQDDDYYDEGEFISIWYETCPHCGRDLKVVEVYKLSEVDVEEVGA